MGILNFLGIGADIAKPLDAVSNLYTTDKAKLEAETNMISVAQKPLLQQLTATSFFASAWPALTGWTAGFCIALYWVPQLLVTNYLWAMHCWRLGVVLPFPIDAADLMNLVYLVFGMGTLHIVKKKMLG